MAEKIQILPDGRVAFLNQDGEIVSVQKPREKQSGRWNQKYAQSGGTKVGHRYKLALNKHGDQLMVPMQLSDEAVAEMPSDISYYDEFRETCLKVANAVAEGQTLTQIGKSNEMPSKRTILYWASKDAAFAACLDEARKWRAEHYHDKIIEVAENVQEDTAKSSKVKIDAFKWVSEVGDREKFGSQTKLVGNAGLNVNIVFQTGIERAAIPAEGTVIEQTADDINGVQSETATSDIAPEPEKI